MRFLSKRILLALGCGGATGFGRPAIARRIEFEYVIPEETSSPMILPEPFES
jgi:hypothetical protein